MFAIIGKEVSSWCKKRWGIFRCNDSESDSGISGTKFLREGCYISHPVVSPFILLCLLFPLCIHMYLTVQQKVKSFIVPNSNARDCERGFRKQDCNNTHTIEGWEKPDWPCAFLFVQIRTRFFMFLLILLVTTCKINCMSKNEEQNRNGTHNIQLEPYSRCTV